MATYKWKEVFLDYRECTVEADSLNEAIKKRDEGDWASEETYNFESQERLTELEIDNA